MRRERRLSGFTLVELIITLAVIAILGLVAAPGLFAYLPVYRVDRAVQVIATELNLVRMRAIAKNRVHHVAFDPAAQTLTVYEDDDNDWSTTNTAVKTLSLATDFPNVSLDYNNVTGLSGSTLSAAASFGSTSSPVRATFLPNGLTSSPGELYLLPAADKGVRNDRLRAIRVSRGGQVARYRYDTASGSWEEY